MYLIGILFSLQFIWAAHEMSSDEIRVLPPLSTKISTFDISVYISEKSSWNKKEVEERLIQANQVFQTCGLGIGRVYFHRWLPSQQLVRTDEIIKESPYYDGMSEAARKSLKVTPLQLFYFEDYLEPFTYGGSVPLAVYPEDYIAQHLHNTAWFPYRSAQRRKSAKSFQYSEEAHELGHILLQKGHDHSGDENIMANNSQKRIPHFSFEQCQNFLFPRTYNTSDYCSQQSNELYPLLATYYKTYKKDYYMTDWCSRNSLNLAQGALQVGLASHNDLQIVYTYISESADLLKPLKARGNNPQWRFHVFVLSQGMVLDLDYNNKPTVMNLEDYLIDMWGDEQLSKMSFQIRGLNDTPAITYAEFKNSLNDPFFPVLNARELKKSHSASCEFMTSSINY